jgi:hypothetical protein
MDFKVFGRFLIFVGALVAAITMLYRTSFLPDWNKAEELKMMREYYDTYQPRRLRIEIDDIRAERDARGEKLLWAAAAGAVVIVLGFGIAVSAKK